jgi:hypothetical protein
MKQYHVLVTGFEISKSNREGKSVGTTNLRHYRYDIETHTLKQDGGAWKVYRGNDFVAAYPVNACMILSEDVDEKER